MVNRRLPDHYPFSASSPVARDHWGIFELIIKESGDEGSDGKGRKSSLLFLPITPRSLPNPHLALGKPVEEADPFWETAHLPLP